MTHRHLLPAAALALLLPLGCPAMASAYAPADVDSPRCNTVRVSNPDSTAKYVVTDQLRAQLGTTLAPGASTEIDTGRGGDFVVLSAVANSADPGHTQWVSVEACEDSPTRPVVGDLDGDGLVDLMAVEKDSGDLWFHRGTKDGFGPGVRTGGGHADTVFLQRVDDLDDRHVTSLVSVRADGTVWRQDHEGEGHFSEPRQIGSGMAGLSNLTITQPNSMLSWGGHALLGSLDGRLFGMRLEGDELAAPAVVDNSWGSTVATLAVGDADGTADGDLLTRGEDGSLSLREVWPDDCEYCMVHPPQTVEGTWDPDSTILSPGSMDEDRLSDLLVHTPDGRLGLHHNLGGHFDAGTWLDGDWARYRLLG